MHLLKYPWNEKSFSPKFKHSASQMLLQTRTLTFLLDSDSWLSEMWAYDLAAQSLWFPEDWFHRNILTSVSSVRQFYPMETENSIFYSPSGASSFSLHSVSKLEALTKSMNKNSEQLAILQECLQQWQLLSHCGEILFLFPRPGQIWGQY